jgi:alpha-1,2-mannosyltransferase
VVIVVVLGLGSAAALWGYGNRHQFADLRIYWGAVNWWASGQSLYDYSVPDPIQGSLGFTYPPFAAVVMYPMSWLTLFASVAAMWVISAVAVVLTTIWLLVPIADRHGWPRWFTVCTALPFIAMLEPIRETVTFGQINLLLAALILVDLLVALPRGSRWAGVGIGLAAAIKLTPAVFIVYLFITRRYRAAITCVGTATAATLIAVAFSPSDSWHYWTSEVWQSSRVGHLWFIPNQSLLGFLSRLAYPHPAQGGLGLTVLCFGMWRASIAGRKGDELVGLTLTGITGALISPVSWQHHLYWFVPALVVLLDVGTSREVPKHRWFAALGVLVLVTVTFSVIAWFDWGIVPVSMEHTPLGLLVSDWHVLLLVALLVLLPIRRYAKRGHQAVSHSPGGPEEMAVFPGSSARSAG